MTHSFNQSLSKNFRELNFIRLILALFVLYSHSYPLGGFGGDPVFLGIKGTSYGSFAVGSFFALSGLLVSLSAQRSTPERYLISRFLRIIPAFFAVLIFSSLVIGPGIYKHSHGSLEGYFTLAPGGPVSSVFRNLTFPLYMETGISDVFATNTPYGISRGGALLMDLFGLYLLK